MILAAVVWVGLAVIVMLAFIVGVAVLLLRMKAGPVEPDAPKLVELYVATDISHAHMIKAVLEDEGIEVFLSNETFQPLSGECPAGWSIAPRVHVISTDVDRAVEIIKDLDEKRQR